MSSRPGSWRWSSPDTRSVSPARCAQVPLLGLREWPAAGLGRHVIDTRSGLSVTVTAGRAVWTRTAVTLGSASTNATRRSRLLHSRGSFGAREDAKGRLRFSPGTEISSAQESSRHHPGRGLSALPRSAPQIDLGGADLEQPQTSGKAVVGGVNVVPSGYRQTAAVRRRSSMYPIL